VTLQSVADALMAVHGVLLAFLVVYGVHRYRVIYLYRRRHKYGPPLPLPPLDPARAPRVTVQLPLYNEKHVAERLVDAACRLDHPADRLEVQALDDSTDETVSLVAARVEGWRRKGVDVVHVRRPAREGYKAGALAWGLERAKGELIAIFDADFVPPPDFLKSVVPHFTDPEIGMVQTRWGHLNAGASLLTRLQALYIDAHFLLEQTARHRSGAFFNFNGTGGVWRRTAIESAGGWSARTLTEDLDLSYRAQLKGWKFAFRPDVVCPAELPPDIHAFTCQQNRWTQGAVQTARRVLVPVWRARLPLHVKVEATLHLTAYLASVVTFLLALLSLPSLLLGGGLVHPALWLGQGAAFAATMGSLALYYGYTQRELHADWRRRSWDIPALFSLGIGLSLTNTAAVWRGLWSDRAEFVRTPKDGDRPGAFGRYARPRGRWRIVQTALAAYSFAALGTALAAGNWAAVPFTALFASGFGYVAWLSRRRAP
jgi:cellulose synthase/poly-beta-1,6-N-acetylglucosamine synthase-like glycosyltransferase